MSLGWLSNHNAFDVIAEAVLHDSDKKICNKYLDAYLNRKPSYPMSNWVTVTPKEKSPQ